jgi:hypothetical protein
MILEMNRLIRKILKKDILKEMEEKSQENLDKGIDIAVSILKNEFPFVTGWKYKDDPKFFNSTVYIILICDMDKSSEFYNSPIKDYYKNLEADVTYPFSPLEMSIEMDNDEKYELYKEIQKSLDETYYEIPNDYRHTFKSYASNTDQPKEIYIDGFVFPAPEKLSEAKEDINEAFDYEYYDKKYGPYKETPEDIEREWTRDELLDYGKNYYSAKFFKMFSPNVYKYATRKRWLRDIGRRLNWDEFAVEQRKIYGFFFECDGKKYVYIGLTKNVTERFESHFNFDMKKSSPFQRTVLGCGIEPEDVEFKVFTTEFLTDKEAGVYETELVAKYKQDPEYTVINVLPGAQMGRTSKKYLPEEIAKIIRIANIKDQNEFIRDYPEQYNYFKRTGRLGRVNELLGFRFFKQVRYNEKELEQIAKQYPSRGKLRLINVNAYEAIRNRGLLDKFFPRDINESESDNDKVSLAKSLIQQLFDEVSFIEQSTYNDRPLLTVYFDSDDTAANIESFFTHEICDTLRDYTSGEIKCNPSWGPEWRTLRNNPDILIDAILLEYDDEGNILNENKRNEIERNLEAINLILSEINWDGLCEIWVEYNEVDGDYEIRSKSTKRHFDYDDIVNELGYLENTLKSMGLKNYIFTPWYVENCEDEVEFLNEDYSPAGKEVIPNEIVVHKSNPIFRDSIMSEGLKAKAGECYKIYVGYGEKCIPAIFATNSTNKRAWFDSTYDDDIWFIDTTKIPDVKWFKDRHFESTKKHIVTFQDIPRDALTLFYEGTGKSEDLMNESEEETTTNYIPIIEEIIEPFKNEDAVCEINVLYDEEDDMYSVYLVLGNEELNNNFYYVNGIRKYRDKLVRKIKAEIKTYLPIDNLYVGSYGKPNCGWSPLNESEDRPNKESINTLINDLILPQYENIICDIEYKDTEERFDVTGKQAFSYPSATVTFIGGYGTKWWPRTQAVQDMYNNILDDVWDTIYGYTGIHVELYSKHVKNCKESINENWYKVPSSDYNSLEKIINLEMKEKYSWWKDIKINTLNYIDLYGDVQIEAELTVDEEWGANQWGEFYYNTKFPGNEGWEDNDGYSRRVSLGDITDSTYAYVIRHDLEEIFKYTLNIESYNTSFRNVYLIFE